MTELTSDAADAALDAPAAPAEEAANSVSPEAEEKPTKRARKAAAPAPAPEAAVVADAVVGLGERDDVSLKACVYKNMHSRKSLTVHHLQRRLRVLGFDEAYADRDGWYGDLTRSSVRQFQEANGLEATGLMDRATFTAIFEGDPNVRIVA